MQFCVCSCKTNRSTSTSKRYAKKPPTLFFAYPFQAQMIERVLVDTQHRNQQSRHCRTQHNNCHRFTRRKSGTSRRARLDLLQVRCCIFNLAIPIALVLAFGGKAGAAIQVPSILGGAARTLESLGLAFGVSNTQHFSAHHRVRVAAPQRYAVVGCACV